MAVEYFLGKAHSCYKHHMESIAAGGTVAIILVDLNNGMRISKMARIEDEEYKEDVIVAATIVQNIIRYGQVERNLQRILFGSPRSQLLVEWEVPENPKEYRKEGYKPVIEANDAYLDCISEYYPELIQETVCDHESV